MGWKMVNFDFNEKVHYLKENLVSIFYSNWYKKRT